MSDMNLDPRKLDGLGAGQAVSVIITLHLNGAMSVEGPVHDKAFMIGMLENAIDSVRNHHMPKSQPGLIIPDKDVVVPRPTPKLLV